jgi:hypothetical protein
MQKFLPGNELDQKVCEAFEPFSSLPEPKDEGALAIFAIGHEPTYSPKGFWYVTHIYEHGDEPEWAVSRISRNIDGALRIPKELNRRGINLKVNIDFYSDDACTVDAHVDPDEERPKIRGRVKEVLPYALCLAGLRALGVS